MKEIRAQLIDEKKSFRQLQKSIKSELKQIKDMESSIGTD